jgi:hypothetical protein
MTLILMLEDDHSRIGRFTASCRAMWPSWQLRIWANAHQMLHEAPELLPVARLISLDHDLEPREGDTTDPGDGLLVAKWLASHSPICPAIVHTSNGARGDAMEGEFELAGWECRRVMPLGDDWIEVDWGAMARKLLRRARRD